MQRLFSIMELEELLVVSRKTFGEPCIGPINFL